MLLLGPSTTKVCVQYLQEFKCLISLITNFLEKFQKVWKKCTSLQRLSFDENSLSGCFPESLFQLKNLSELNLQCNSISGSLINGISNLSNLVKLDISSNLFSGVLPDIFGGFARLEHFLAMSNLFTGHLPNSLVDSPSLQMLNLNNSLSGPINLNCYAMKNLLSLGLGSNYSLVQFLMVFPSAED